MRMRIGLMAMGCVMALSSPGFAQELTGSVKVGVSIASLNVEGEEDEIDFKSKAGVIAGASIGIRVNEMFSVQPEVLFVQKGAHIEGGGEEGTVKLDYLEIPILGVFSFSTAGTARPFVLVGPAFGAKMNAKLEVSGQEEPGFDDEVKGSDVGIVFGAGVEVSRFIVEGRYNLGLTNIAEEGEEVKNRAFSILAGIRF